MKKQAMITAKQAGFTLIELTAALAMAALVYGASNGVPPYWRGKR